jgi:hypothetical protein
MYIYFLPRFLSAELAYLPRAQHLKQTDLTMGKMIFYNSFILQLYYFQLNAGIDYLACCDCFKKKS